MCNASVKNLYKVFLFKLGLVLKYNFTTLLYGIKTEVEYYFVL